MYYFTSCEIFTPVFIIIIMSRNLHGYPWRSLAKRPYHSLPLGGPLRSIQYQHRASLRTSLLGSPHWRAHVIAFTEERHLWVHLDSPAVLKRVLFTSHGLFVWYGIGGRTGTFSWGCCFHDLFKTARSILVQLPSSLFSRRFVRVQVVQPCIYICVYTGPNSGLKNDQG